MMLQKALPQNAAMSKRAIEILHLLSEGMSDREIAEHLTVTVNTVKWYNRQIYSTLGVGGRNEAMAYAYKFQSRDDKQVVASVPQFGQRELSQQLPAKLTPFIGREDELRVIQELLNRARLVTLVGPPGVGKTRLALQTASDMADAFHSGVYFVSLEAVRDPALVIPVIARHLGVSESRSEPLIETVKRFLQPRELLLILDNFEHLGLAAIQISELLSASTQLQVLVTSRAPIHVYGEQEYAVPSLTLPDLSKKDLSTLTSNAAITLFIQRARSVQPDFQITEENALEIAEICAQLHGLPLAIELAAARLKMLSLPGLLTHLKTNPLDTLVTEACDLPLRQRTMRNTLHWSYDLLNEHEKALFIHLAGLHHPCSLEAIADACNDQLSSDVFHDLLSLVDKSLIERTVTAQHEPRFYMFNVMREYAKEQLPKTSVLEDSQMAIVEISRS
jgi:predicted ATPase/DNA-binding CsgD family transcriptional regulator